jgi:hypothetical protein
MSSQKHFHLIDATFLLGVMLSLSKHYFKAQIFTNIVDLFISTKLHNKF